MKKIIAKLAYWLLQKSGWKPDAAEAVQVFAVLKYEDIFNRGSHSIATEIKRKLCVAIGEEVFSRGLLCELRFTDNLVKDLRIYSATLYVKIPPGGKKRFSDNRKDWEWVYPFEIG